MSMKSNTSSIAFFESCCAVESCFDRVTQKNRPQKLMVFSPFTVSVPRDSCHVHAFSSRLVVRTPPARRSRCDCVDILLLFNAADYCYSIQCSSVPVDLLTVDMSYASAPTQATDCRHVDVVDMEFCQFSL